MNTLTWELKINGKRYGSGVHISKKFKTQEELNKFLEVFSYQIKLSLQKIFLGKTELDEKLEKAKEKYKNLS